MIDLWDALLDMLEPPAVPPVTRELLGQPLSLGASGTWRDTVHSEPFMYDEPDVLYLFEWGADVREPAGAGPQEIERFAVQAVYVAPLGDEEVMQRRRRDVTEALDAKRELYATRIRERRTASTWQYITVQIDGDYQRTFDIRGFALRISGWRIMPRT